MRINYNNPSINTIQNNLLKNLHLTNAKYAKDDTANISVTVSLSEESVDKYFEEGIFNKNSIFSDSDSLSNLVFGDKNTSDVVKQYGKKYAEVYEKIMSHVDDDKKSEYIDKLDAAFAEAIEKESNSMSRKISKLLEGKNMDSNLNQSFSRLFKDVAYAVKDFYVKNSDEDLSTYVNTKVNFSQREDFKTFEAFSTVMDIVDLSDGITNKMNRLKDMLISNSPDDIIESKDLFNTINAYSQSINHDIEKLNKLKETLNEDDLGDSVKKDLMKAIDDKITGLNDMNGKMQRYKEYLEKYDKIQKKIKKAIAKRDALNAKLDTANQAKNEDLIGMYLKRVATADSEIAELKAQSAEIEAEMANLLKDIKETDI